ncbi:hypothetical protein PG990_014950 [Apiospora arundinis]
MACDKKTQKTSVENLERRLAKLTMKADQAKAEAYKALNKKTRGTGIFSKSPEACERDFMAELDRLEKLNASSRQPKKVPTETEFMAELDRVDKLLAKSQGTKKACNDISILFPGVLS